MAIFIFITGMTSACMVPKRIDTDRKKGIEEDNIIDVPFEAFFKNRRVLMGLIASVIAGTIICFYDPILAMRMEDIGVESSKAGLAFIACAGSFAITAPFMGCLAEVVDRRIMIQFGFIGAAVGLILSGGLMNNSVEITYIGLVIGGICFGVSMVPMIPEIIGVMNEDLVSKQQEEARLSGLAIENEISPEKPPKNNI